jgi:hypothetical protein
MSRGRLKRITSGSEAPRGQPEHGRTLGSHPVAVYPDPATSVRERPHSEGIPTVVREKRMGTPADCSMLARKDGCRERSHV